MHPAETSSRFELLPPSDIINLNNTVFRPKVHERFFVACPSIRHQV